MWSDDRIERRASIWPRRSSEILASALTVRLRGEPCRFYGSDLKIQVAEGHIRYPDLMVVCSAVDRKATVVHDPVIVFEVLSPSTGAKDRIVKAREYQATPSVQHYVMLEQDSVGATVYARAGDAWTHEILIAGSILVLPEIGVELPLDEGDCLRRRAGGRWRTSGRARPKGRMRKPRLWRCKGASRGPGSLR